MDISNPKNVHIFFIHILLFVVECCIGFYSFWKKGVEQFFIS